MHTTIKGIQTRVLDYCYPWNYDNKPGSVYCYLRGGLAASKCRGASKSSVGDFYWTTDSTLCTESDVFTRGRLGILKNRSSSLVAYAHFRALTY